MALRERQLARRQLASALSKAGHPATLSLLESTARHHPADVWINYHPAEMLAGFPARREEEVRHYTAARALRPESPHNLGLLLEQVGRDEDAIATFGEPVRVPLGEARDLGCLGTTLLVQQRPEDGLGTLDLPGSCCVRRSGKPRHIEPEPILPASSENSSTMRGRSAIPANLRRSSWLSEHGGW